MKKLLQMKFMLLLCALIVGSGTMWADTATLSNANIVAAGNAATSYASHDISDGTNIWHAYAIKNQHSNATSGYHYLQIKKYASNTAYYIQVPEFGTKITSITMTVSGSSQAMTAGGNTATLYFSSSNSTSAAGTGVASGTGGSSVTIDCSSLNLNTGYITAGGAVRIWDVTVTYTAGGSTTYSVTYDGNGATSGTVPTDATAYAANAEVTVLDNTGNLAKTGCAFDGWNTQANGGGTTYAVGSKFNISANTTLYAKWTPYTITALSNNESYGTVSLSDNVITGSPNSGYRYANPAYTVSPENSATVVQDGNTFTVTPTANTTITINFEAIPTHTATFSVNGTTTTTDFQEGEAITFPANPADIEEKSFVGWTTTPIDGTTNTAPNFVTSATMGNADITYYAVFADVTPGTSTSITDHLTTSTFGSPTNYTSWTNKTAANGSDAVYAGNSSTYSNTAIQLRSNNSNSGIVTTASGGKAKKVTVSWNNDTQENRTLDIYGKNTAYSAASDLYGTNTQGTKIGSIVFDGESTELTISGDYEFIGLRSNSGAMYINQIDIDWETGTPDTYSGYCTTVAADTREEAGLGFVESTVIVEWYNAAQYTGQALTNPHSVSPITWTSSNEEVATVEDGTVKVLALGETTIKASFDGDENYKKGEASYTLTVQDSRTALELSFDPESVEVNVNETVAIPTLNGNLGNGAVTYASDDANIATVTEDANTSLVVTGLAEGTTTITATVAATNEYKEGTATFTVTVIDPNAPGTVNNPYTVAQAIAATPASGTTDNVYIKGIVSQFYNTSIVDDGSNYRYYISDDGTKTTQLLVYKGKGLNNTAFANADDLQIGDEVIILGKLTTYQNTKEVASGNYLVSLDRKPDLTPSIVFDDKQSLNVLCTAGEADIHFVASNITGTVDVVLCDANGGAATYDWFSAALSNDNVHIQWQANEDPENSRTAFFKLTNGTTTSDIFALTQANYTVTYTLAHSITPGKHYIIASGTDGNVYVMGGQKSTNREAVEVEITTKNVISVTDEKICEFIVSKDGAYYTFFDENLNGYLNATGAGGTNNNHLKTLGVNDNKGQWSISIDDGGVATVIANATGRNTMRFNNGSSKLFSCYSSGQQDIYLFEKDNDEGSLVIPIAAACTDGTKCYATFSSTKPFVVPEDLTVSEIGIDTDGTMNVENYETGAVVPANTGVMVSAVIGDRSYVANVSTEVGNNVLNGDNRLRPTGDTGLTALEMNSAEPETCKFYRLTMHNGTTIGFWWGADGGDSFDIVANKAYLAVPASVAGARNGFAFGDDSTTGISNVNVNENVNGSVFDLQGRKVNKPGKGLYIVNGKKVVIK
jgi:hypothetical protein